MIRSGCKTSEDPGAGRSRDYDKSMKNMGDVV